MRGEWGNTVYPSVPGHEIVGRVTAVGDLVSKFKIGQRVGVSRSCPASRTTRNIWLPWRPCSAPASPPIRRCTSGVSAPVTTPGVFNLIMKRRRLAGSLIGGIKETQEMLDFCARHNIVSNIEMIRMDEVEAAYERMLKSDVKYRFVIELATMKSAA